MKYVYLDVDQKDWDGMVELLAPTATAAYSAGKFSFDNRDEIIDFLRRNMDRAMRFIRVTRFTIPKSTSLVTGPQPLGRSRTPLSTASGISSSWVRRSTRTTTSGSPAVGSSAVRHTDAPTSSCSRPPRSRALR